LGAVQFAKQIDHAPKLVVLKQILEDCGIGLGGGGGSEESGGSDLQSGGASSGHRVLVFAQLKGLLVRGPIPSLISPIPCPLSPYGPFRCECVEP
jgi:hypothetical protein